MSLSKSAVALVAVFLASTSQFGLLASTSEEPAEPQAPKYEEHIGPGDLLPIESVVDIDGRTVDLANPDRRKLVILFATWCKDSNRALKALNASQMLDDDSIEVIAIAREETADVVTAWRDAHGIRVPLAADPDRSIYKRFAAAGVPRFITVDTDNRVIKMNLAEVEDPLTLVEWR